MCVKTPRGFIPARHNFLRFSQVDGIPSWLTSGQIKHPPSSRMAGRKFF